MMRSTTTYAAAAGSHRMSSVQIAAVVLCLLMNLMDGFDLLAMAFTAPAVTKEWAIPAERLGLLFSAGLAGMAVGALFISPLGDMVGRRRTIMLCLTLVAGGMIAAAFTESVGTLAAARIVTGMGIGAIISNTGAMVYEFSSDRFRGLTMGMMGVCFPAGATLGGSVALLLMDQWGWRGVFLAGGIATGIILPAVALLLPESPSFLLQSRKPDALKRANAVLARMGLPPRAALTVGSTERENGKLAIIFGPQLRVSTVALAGLFSLVMLSFYFIINWVPKLIVQTGGTERAGITAGLLLNLGGMAGGLIAGLATSRFGIAAVTRVAITGMALAIAGFGLAIGYGDLTVRGAAMLLGFAMFATMSTIYMLLAAAYPPRVRTTAAGLIATAGRIGSVLGPLAGGLLLGLGWMPVLICALLAAPALIAAQLARYAPASNDE